MVHDSGFNNKDSGSRLSSDSPILLDDCSFDCLAVPGVICMGMQQPKVSSPIILAVDLVCWFQAESTLPLMLLSMMLML